MLKKSDELKDRVEAKTNLLMAKLNELSADTRHEAREAADGLKKKLSEVQEHIKDGWEHLTEAASAKINSWLDN